VRSPRIGTADGTEGLGAFAVFCAALALGFAGREVWARRSRVAALAVEGVRWKVYPDTDEEASPDTLVLPVYPFEDPVQRMVEGTNVSEDEMASIMVYLPHTTPQVSFKESHHLQMYNDIILSGARRVLVTPTSKVDGVPAVGEIASVLYLDEYEVKSEDPKTISCTHTVIGRARITKLLNPVASGGDEPQYLRAEVELIEENDERAPELEAEAKKLLTQMIEAYEKSGVNPRFGRRVEAEAEFTPVGLWKVLAQWQQLLEVRRMDLVRSAQQDVMKTVGRCMEAGDYSPSRDREGRLHVHVPDLPDDVQFTLRSIHNGLHQEVDDPRRVVLQQFIEAPSHRARLELFCEQMREEVVKTSVRIRLASMMRS
jgi:hypothetical protein